MSIPKQYKLSNLIDAFAAFASVIFSSEEVHLYKFEVMEADCVQPVAEIFIP